jgi:biopolymer transport protein ExbD
MRRKRFRVHADMASGSEFSTTSVFVTPMLDMAFQILAFFVFTYSPTAVEGQFPITLAQGETAGEAPNVKPDQKVASDQPTELRPTIFVEARAKERGKLASIRIRTPDGMTMISPPVGGDEADKSEAMLKSLAGRLVELKKQNPSEDRITIEGTPTLRWEELMRVIDVCRRTKAMTSNTSKELFPKVNLGYIEQ